MLSIILDLIIINIQPLATCGVESIVIHSTIMMTTFSSYRLLFKADKYKKVSQTITWIIQLSAYEVTKTISIAMYKWQRSQQWS